MNKINTKHLLIGVGTFIFGSSLSLITSPFIQNRYPFRPIVPDLLFDITPYYKSLEIWTDIIPLLSIIAILYVSIRWQKLKLGFGFLALGIMQIFRSIIIPLTPMGRPTGNEDLYGFFKISQNGMFPSGHFMSVIGIFFLVRYHQNPTLKTFLLFLSIAEGITLILSHGHYTIDIIGGGMLAYIVINELRFRNVFHIQEIEKTKNKISDSNK